MDGLPPLFTVRRNIVTMMAARDYIVEEQEKTPEEYVRDFCQVSDDGKLVAVNKDALTLSLVHKITRKPMRVFFFSGNGKLGKKSIQGVLNRMGDTITRAVVVVPEGGNPTPSAKKLMDEMNRSNSEVFIQWFMERELETNVLAVGRIERKFHVLTPTEKRALLKRYDKDEKHYPFIAYDDPVARYYGLQRGDVIKCLRSSETAGRYVKFQICRYVEEVPKESANKRPKPN